MNRLLLSWCLLSTAAFAETRVSGSASAGYLASPGASGSALTAGVELRFAKHFAAGFDFGYGLLDAGPWKQDRWWLMPMLSGLLDVGPVRLEAGLGLGLATSSGYPSWSNFGEGPFNPTWAFQLAPAVRAHVGASLPLREHLALFARVEAGSLLLGGNPIGFRSGNPAPTVTDTTWVNTALGLRFGAL